MAVVDELESEAMPGAEWLSQFPGLAGLAPAEREALARAGRHVALRAGSRIFGPGQAPAGFLLLTAGTVRVHQTSEGGREIVLYRVAAGEICALTTACLLGYEEYLAEAVAETDVEAVIIPRETFDGLIASSAGFRKFVFAAFSRRVTDLSRIIDEVAFQRLDIRLAAKLIELAEARNEIAITHQELAAELGSAREVISRQLHELQRRGIVASGRGQINIVDRPSLERLAAA